ncbi:hypothetical protein [Bartonella sp. CM120XJJH]|uniref:hypothetical protein n=1 Tax=Bartonella sp. CM120XJJH TaxID=3243544 RepID=UPI0035CFB02D
MNTINFLSYKYKIDPASELVNINGVDKFLEEGRYSINRDNQCATLIIEKFSVNSKICYWIYVLTGENSPYNPEVIDSENDFQNIPNPRSKNQIEQNKQYFGILIPIELTLFSSNKELNKFLQLHYKKSFPPKTIDISPDIVGKEEFEKKLRLIKEIKLKYTQPKQSDFFAMQSEDNLLKMAKLLLGEFPTDDYSEMELDLGIKFKEKNNLKNYFLNLFKKYKLNPEFKNISFVGKTHNNFDIIFNTETFQHKFAIKTSKNDNGMYNEGHIKEKLKHEIVSFTVSL